MRGELAPEVEAEILRRARSGEATAVIAKDLGVGETTVRRLRTEHGIAAPAARPMPARARPSLIFGRRSPGTCQDCGRHVTQMADQHGRARMYDRELSTFAVRDPETGRVHEAQGYRRHAETCGRTAGSPRTPAEGT